MLTVSNDFKTAMKQPVKQLAGYIELSNGDRITNADDLISFKISCDTGLCKTGMRKLEAKYLGEHNLLGQWVHIGFGVKLSNGTYEYLDYGSFLVSEITNTKDTDTTTITGYDKMINAMKSYEAPNITYPMGLYDYTKALCSHIGLELGNNSFDVHNDWIVSQDLWTNISGITYRDILLQIAQVTCTTCIISNDDKVYFKSLNNTNEKLTYANMKKLKLEPIYGEINSVVLSRTPQEDNIYRRDETSILNNGLTEWKIENNEIIDKDRDNAITPIYNAMHGINYYPFETTTEGLGWYEVADTFNIENNTGDIYNVSLFNFSISVDGSITEVLKTSAETKTQTQYQYATNISKRLKNTEIIVDKQNNSIREIVEDIEVIEQSVEVFRNTLDRNNLFIPTNADNYPLETKDYLINTTSYYSDEVVTPQISISGSVTGLTVSVINQQIKISTNINNAITNLTNALTVNFVYTKDETIYRNSKSLTITLVKQGEDGVIQSSTEPTDTTKVWCNTNDNNMYRYSTETSAWILIDDYNGMINAVSNDVHDVDAKVGELNTNLSNNYSNTNEVNQLIATSKSETIVTLQAYVDQSKDGWEYNVIKAIQENGVTKVSNTMVTIDIDGIKVAINTNDFNTLLNNLGLYMRDGSTLVSKVDKDGFMATNIKNTGKYETSYTMTECITDENNEECEATYWIGG